MMHIKRSAFSENVFFYLALCLILFALGYGFFNNTANHLESDSDAMFYLFMAENGHSPDATDHRAGRILMPKMVSVVYKYLHGMVGSWDSLKFSFFVINSFFMILSIIFYQKICRFFGFSNLLIKVSGLIFITSFSSTNYFLRASVDPGEILFLAALTWLLLSNRLSFTPLIFIFGVANRETFLAVGIALFIADLTYEFFCAEKNSSQLFFKFFMLLISIFTGIVTHILVQYHVSGALITPFSSLQEFNSLPEWGENRSPIQELRRFLYVFFLPIASLFFLKLKLPMRILFHVSAVFLAIILGSWIASTSGTGLSRYLFTGAGFYLSMHIASCLLWNHDK